MDRYVSEAACLAPGEQLARELQALKSAAGLSYTRIGERTHYAKSSWERWVNGKQFPPRSAVESIAIACEGDAEHLLALWDLADAERTAAGEPGLATTTAPDPSAEPAGEAEAGPEPGPASPPEPRAEAELAPSRPWYHRPAVLWSGAALALVVVAGSAVAVVTGVFGDAGHASGPVAAVHVAGPATGCFGKSCEGKDPAKMNCSADAVTSRTGSIPKDLVIELRYSKACGAAWGRISFAQVGSTVDVDNSDGAAAANVVHFDRDVYTPLIAAPDNGSTWVCASLTNAGPRSCTGRFIPQQEP